ncbi:putative H(+)-transporting two-sector ATPase [Rosa chinensis]|uniref:Putative H(+)-transporting two-sector ATPase n=1 Tax=Rosa chinensis TaxID=74649 RepID=A0A2P6PMC1_ROSCH|nr:putative H(+)-transporting two-sector ATPase [Rosa chinensis]
MDDQNINYRIIEHRMGDLFYRLMSKNLRNLLKANKLLWQNLRSYTIT